MNLSYQIWVGNLLNKRLKPVFEYKINFSIYFLVLWIHKVNCGVKKLVRNVRIINAYWYTNKIKPPFLNCIFLLLFLKPTIEVQRCLANGLSVIFFIVYQHFFFYLSNLKPEYIFIDFASLNNKLIYNIYNYLNESFSIFQP